jgi:hypothetical protein
MQIYLFELNIYFKSFNKNQTLSLSYTIFNYLFKIF